MMCILEKIRLTNYNRRLRIFRTAEELRILCSIPVYETFWVNSSKISTYTGGHGSNVHVQGIDRGSECYQLSQSLNLTNLNYILTLEQ